MNLILNNNIFLIKYNILLKKIEFNLLMIKLILIYV